jgi:hypothetical protein
MLPARFIAISMFGRFSGSGWREWEYVSIPYCLIAVSKANSLSRHRRCEKKKSARWDGQKDHKMNSTHAHIHFVIQWKRVLTLKFFREKSVKRKGSKVKILKEEKAELWSKLGLCEFSPQISHIHQKKSTRMVLSRRAWCWFREDNRVSGGRKGNISNDKSTL